MSCGTAQRHLDECRAKIEQQMLDDTRGQGAMRFEEDIKRKRARPNDEGDRQDVAMEVAEKNPILCFVVVPVCRGKSDQSHRGAGTLRSNLAETSEQDCRISGR